MKINKWETILKTMKSLKDVEDVEVYDEGQSYYTLNIRFKYKDE